ncbi:MAG: class I adenylate-forming enzyme family protein, partial [Patescibacteria group bacterium]
MTDGETGAVYSYAQLNEWVDKSAAFLSRLGVSKGERFATLTRNCPEFFFLYLASLKVGALIIPLVVDLPVEALTAHLERFQARAVFYGAEAEDSVRGVAAGTVPSLLHAIPIRSLTEAVASLVPDTSLYHGVTLDDPGSIYFSSGTTGQPKGIPHTPRNLLAASRSLADAYGFTEKDTQMGVLPCYHTALAMYGFWPGIWRGSNFVLFERFHKSMFWENIARHRAAFVEV